MTPTICLKCGAPTQYAKTGRDPRAPNLLEEVNPDGTLHERSCKPRKLPHYGQPKPPPPPLATDKPPPLKRIR